MATDIKCRDCGRRIGPSSPYAARRVGPKCGGRLKSTHPRLPAIPSVPVASSEECADQMALFELATVAA
jgi:hypothetical protein